MDQKQITERVRAAFGGARGGKISKIEPGEDSRVFVITTLAAFDPEKATLKAHGLEYICSEKDMISGIVNRVTVRIDDGLWEKLHEDTSAEVKVSDSKFAPMPDDSIETALRMLELNATGNLQKHVKTLRSGFLGTSTRTSELQAANDALERQNEQLRGQLEDDNEQLAALTGKLTARSTPNTSIWLAIPISRSGQTVNDSLEKLRADGYTLVHEMFVPVGATDIVWCGRLEPVVREPIFGNDALGRLIQHHEPLQDFLSSVHHGFPHFIDAAGGSRREEPIPESTHP